MSILNFDKPKKIRSTDEHNKIYSSDCAALGTYVPNMSDEDNNKWKAKHIESNDERVEIRKSFDGTQVVIVVYKNIIESDWKNNIEGHKNIRISANSKIHMTLSEYNEFIKAIEEAKQIIGLV
jgi:hypothetical protein